MKNNNSKRRGLSPPVIRVSIVGFSFVAAWGVLVIYAGGGGAGVLGGLQFLDPIILPGIEIYSSCYSGDAVVNKYLLMIAWFISLVLFFLMPLLLGDSVKWYFHHLSEFRYSKIKFCSRSPKIIFVPLYWLIGLMLFVLFIPYLGYNYVHFMGFGLADQLSCLDLRDSPKTGYPSLFREGLMPIIAGFIWGDLLTFLMGFIKFHRRAKYGRIE